ncbi:MAG: hypothetical protein WCD79_22665 [Chthoniobacteraceae bacterium]
MLQKPKKTANHPVINEMDATHRDLSGNKRPRTASVVNAACLLMPTSALQALLLAPYGKAKRHLSGHRVVYRLILARLIAAHPQWQTHRQTGAGLLESGQQLKSRKSRSKPQVRQNALFSATGSDDLAPYLKALARIKKLIGLIDAISPTLVTEDALRIARDFACQSASDWELLIVTGRHAAGDRNQRRRTPFSANAVIKPSCAKRPESKRSAKRFKFMADFSHLRH